VTNDRDRWVKAFNRLDAAITHHRRDTLGGVDTSDEADEALWAARDKIIRDLGPEGSVDCGHPAGCSCARRALEKIPCGYDTLALCRAATGVRDGRWYYGAPTHVFADLLDALAADGIVLARAAKE
jgi:hypothetical protein